MINAKGDKFKMGLGGKLKEMVRNWLEIQPSIRRVNNNTTK